MATAPVVTPVTDYLFVFNEKVGVTGDNTVHLVHRDGALSDDNNTSIDGPPPPNYELPSIVGTNPNPTVLHGSLDVHLIWSTNPSGTTGTLSIDVSFIDKQLDFLRENQVMTQQITIRVKDLTDNLWTNEVITIQAHGRNDKPIARPDFFTISENVTVGKFALLGNDTDVDLGDTEAAVSAAILSVSAPAAPFLTKAMLKALLIDTPNDADVLKDGLQISLDVAFQGLATGENALIVVNYTMRDYFGATATSQLRLTVQGSNDAQIVGTGANDIFLFGEKDADTIFALGGNDIIYPRGGNDIVYTGPGSDIVIFNTPLGTSTNKDTIKDFDHTFDTFRLENLIFTKLGAPGALNPAFFRAGPAALDANDFILYNQPTGGLFYDFNANAAGGLIQIGFLENKPVLQSNDFQVM